MQCIEGTQVKAYYTHSNDNEALSSIGYFENFEKKPTENGEFKIVGDFTALNAWKEGSEKEYKTFFELADKAPEVFGISCSAIIKSGYYTDEGDFVELNEELPSEETKIYAFAEKVLSWDVVSTPATNPNGLFSSETEIEEEEEPQEDSKQYEENIANLVVQLETQTEITTELKSQNVSLAEENEELTEKVKELESKIESLEIGSEPVEHNFSEEIDIVAQIEQEQDWARKSKLIMSTLNNFELKVEKKL